MPRNYSPFTASGDPTNPLSLLSQTIEIPQVNYTAQTAVAEPENQFETLQKILGLAAGAATSVMGYKENKIKNEMALNAAIERSQAKQEAAIEEAERKEERAQYKAEREQNKLEAAEKEAQNNILNSFDARITSALLREDFAEAERLGTEFEGMYPVEKNPFMANKAQDQKLRIKTAKTAFDANADRETAQLSAATQGAVLSDSLGGLERLQGQFNGLDSRDKVMQMFDAIPDDQLHVALNNYLLSNPVVPSAKLNLLSDEDRVELNTTLLRSTDALRTSIIRERNNRRTYDRIQLRNQAAVTLATQVGANPRDTANTLTQLFAEYDNIQNDKDAGFINTTQQNNLERNLTIAIGNNAGKAAPVVGAITMARLIEGGVQAGDIPIARGQAVIKVLMKRAEMEMQSTISTMRDEARRQPNVNDQTALYEMSPSGNPAIELGDRLGVYEVGPDGERRVAPYMDGIAQQLDTLSKEWARQEAAFTKSKGVAGNVATIDNTFMVDADVRQIDAAIANQDLGLTNEDRSIAMTNLAVREFNGSLAFRNDPVSAERHIIPLKRVVDKETKQIESETPNAPMVKVTVKGGRQFSVPDFVAQDPAFQDFVAAVGDPNALPQALMSYYADRLSQGGSQGDRAIWLYGMKVHLETTMTDSQMRTAENPTLARTYSQGELLDVATTASTNLFKRSDKMDVIQRDIEEEYVGRLVAASQSVPLDWVKHISKNYFAAGASEDSLKKGYKLILDSRGTVIDQNGVQVNYASVGTVASEIAMQQEDPVMYETLVIAEGLAIGTNKDPSEFLQQAHTIAVQRNAQLEATKGIMKTQGELVPQPAINFQTGLPMRDSGTLYGKRLEGLRAAFKETFNKDIPRQPFDVSGIDNDPYFSLDVEDYNRMNAVFQGFKAKGYGDDVAIKAAVSTMKRMGYSVVTNEEQAGATVGLIFDPYAVNPPDDVKNTVGFKSWVEKKINEGQTVKKSINLGDGRSRGGAVIKYLTTADLTTPDSKVPFVLIYPNGERFEYTGQNGISYRDYLEDMRAQELEAEANRINPAF